MFGAPNLIARIYVFTLTEYLRLFGRILELLWETDQEERLLKKPQSYFSYRELRRSMYMSYSDMTYAWFMLLLS